MKPKTFAIPLAKKTSTPFRNVSNDHKEIAKRMRELFGPSWYPIDLVKKEVS